MGEPQQTGAAASPGAEPPGEGAGVILTPDQRVRVFISSTLGSGPDFYTTRTDPVKETQRLIAKLEALGHKVTLTPAA
jgi:hypothetical protein